MPPTALGRPLHPALAIVLLAVAGFAAQALLWLNPGYFSHDELQWGAFAAAAPSLAELPWVSWVDVGIFQFRPLTFNLWLPLSWLLFDTPRLFHALFVALGTGNALLLFGLLRRRFGTAPALAGFVMFLLGPYAAWVHGWVATLADLLWVAAALLIAWLLETGQRRHVAWIALGSLLLTAAALLAKEAALAIPALLGLGWLVRGLDRRWLAALGGASVAAGLYLMLRLAPIDAGSSAGSYAWSAGNIPLRLAEYFVFPWLLERSEPTSVWLPQPTFHWVIALSMLGLLLIGLLRAGWRGAALWLLASVVALGPTLLLGAPSNQYAYGFAAVLAAAVAQAWTRSRYWLLLPLLVWVLHGLHIQMTMYGVGHIQQRFHADLIVELERDRDASVVVWAEHRSWIYHRLTHEIPAYRGVGIGPRVRVVDQPDIATHRAARDGSLHPLGAAD
jgi:hypothetical protein